jgi:hypothetical protein
MTLLDILEYVEDKRRAQGRRYDLKNFLFISILAILCGARSYKDIETFMNTKFDKLKILLNLRWKNAPKRTMINDTLGNIDIDSLEKAFRIYSSKLLPKMQQNKTTSIDGKTLNGSYDNKNGERALHLLMAFCSNNKIVLGHVNVTKDKTNEIPCAQELVSDLGINEGTIFTLDAMHCQKKLSQI